MIPMRWYNVFLRQAGVAYPRRSWLKGNRRVDSRDSTRPPPPFYVPYMPSHHRWASTTAPGSEE